jgi:hypothetical protein
MSISEEQTQKDLAYISVYLSVPVEIMGPADTARALKALIRRVQYLEECLAGDQGEPEDRGDELPET